MKESETYDRKPLKTKHQLETAVKQAFKDQQRLLRGMRKEYNNSMVLDVQSYGAYCDRRTQAIIKYMDEIRQRFSGKYPGVLLDLDYIKAETASIQDYDMLDDHYLITTAAALWLLDQLKIQGKLEEAYRMLQDDDDVETVKMADVYDTVHPQVSIMAMTYTIQTRNDSIQNDDNYCYVVDEGTARRRKVSSAFRDIVALLDSQVIDDVVAEYQAAVWDWLDHFFALNADFSRKLDAALAKMKAAANPPKPNISVLQNPETARSFMQSTMMNPFNSIMSYEREMENAAHRLEEADKKQHAMFMFVQHKLDREDRIGPKAEEAFADYKAMDPFSACFALIWMLDSGSDFPFLYFAGVGALEESCQKLPWLHDSNKKYYGSAVEKNITVYEEGIAEDWYEKAQKLFDATGCLIPRNSGLYNWGEKRVGKKLSPAAAILMDMRRLEKLKLQFRLAQFDYDEDLPDPDAEEQNDDTEDEVSNEQLREENKKYRQEIESLRKLLYDARRDAQSEHHQREMDTAAHESERQELIDLRNYVFSLEQEDDAPNDELSAQITLPYTVKKRILVFGGHDSWLKVIRGMLNGVRWIDKNERVNPEIIKHADIVFIQTNAMPHKMFYSVDESCKKYKVPMRYCCSASAERCALQIAEADLAE